MSCSIIFFFPKKAQLSLWRVQYLKKKIVLISLQFQLNNEVLLASFMFHRICTISAIHEKFALIFSLGQYKPLERKDLTGIIISCLLDSSVWSMVRVEGCLPRCYCKHTNEILLHTSVWLDFYSHLVITSAVQSGDFAYLLKVLFYHFPNDWSSAGWWIIFTLVCNKEANTLFDYFSVHGGDIWERHILSFIVLCYLLRANIIILTTCYI